MSRILIIFMAVCLVLIATVFFTSCESLHVLVASGKTVSQSFALMDFTRISTGWTFNVQVSQSEVYAVVIAVDDNLKDYLEVSKDGETLKIGMKKGYRYNDTHFKAMVTLPRLGELTISGASKGSVADFTSSGDFILNVSGASQSNLTNMGVNKLVLDISGASRASGCVNASGDARLQASGASDIELTGKAGNVDIESSGASTVNLTDFTVGDASVNLSGASNATVNASGTLSGDISGASHLYYIGMPTLGSIHTSGASSINKK